MSKKQKMRMSPLDGSPFAVAFLVAILWHPAGELIAVFQLDVAIFC